MKTSKFLRNSFLSLLLMAGISACDNGFQELNKNPNAPTEAGSQYILPRAEQTSMDRTYSLSGLNGYVGAIWSQQYAKIQYTEEDRYDFSGRVSLVNNIWESFYSRSLADLQQIKDQAANGEQQNLGHPASFDDNQAAVADILMVWNFQMLTDVWGPVPYSEALKGMAQDAISQPAYDSQESIYKDLISRLTADAAAITPGASPFGREDLIYGGDMAQWRKLANSLRMRLAMRLSEVDAAYAETEFVKAYNTGNYIETYDDNAEFGYGGYPYNNPVNDFERTRVDHKFSLNIDTLLWNRNDPRRRIYAMPVATDSVRDNANDGIRGVQNGDVNNSQPLGNVSTMGAFFIAPTSPGRIMTAAETKLLIAEATIRGWVSDMTAKQAYDEGVTTAMQMYSDDHITGVIGSLQGNQAYDHQSVGEAYDGPYTFPPAGVTQQEINNYLALGSPAAFPITGTQQEQLNAVWMQQYLALYGQGLEAWTNWRRTNVPTLQPGPEAVLDQVPTRLRYPSDEQSLNKGNNDAAVQMLGGPDAMTTNVWWDK